MDVTIRVPEDIADRWQAQGDIPRDVLEGVVLEAYRKRIIGESRLQRWLGFETRFDVHHFLKEHGVPINYNLDDLEQDRQTHDRLGL
jgi:predicted HTH domain antitoxin